ncbi:MAG: cyclophilin-like fold protein [bacterium]
MDRKIKILAGDLEAGAVLAEGPTADLLWEALPIEGRASTWGEEIYFAIPLEAPQEGGAREEMAPGEIAYWPPGKAFCIFFGPTPASTGEAPRAASPVNPLGRVEGDPKRFLSVADGAAVRLERAP